MFYSGLVQTLGILLTFTELGVGGGGVTGLNEISSSGLTSGFSENMHSKSICYEKINKLWTLQDIWSFVQIMQDILRIKMVQGTWQQFIFERNTACVHVISESFILYPNNTRMLFYPLLISQAAERLLDLPLFL